MPQLLQLTIRSGRLVLWPAVILNTGLVAFDAGASLLTSLLLAVALSCVASFGFIINDCADVAVDSVNRVGRLETATVEKRRSVNVIGKILLCVGLYFSFLVNSLALGIMVGIAAGLVIYTHLARQRLVFATLLASILASAPLWFANLALGAKFTNLQSALIVAVLLFLMARELVFDAQDQAGDKHGGRRTFATAFGARTAISISLALHIAGAALLLFVVGLAAGSSNWWPLILADVVLFIALIFPAVWHLQSKPATTAAYARFTFCSRAAMLLIPVIWLVA